MKRPSHAGIQSGVILCTGRWLGDYLARIRCLACNNPASSSVSSYVARFRRALEWGISEYQLKRGG